MGIKRTTSRLKRFLSELKYVRELYGETVFLFEDYDAELNYVLDDISSIKNPTKKEDNDSKDIAPLSKEGDEASTHNKPNSCDDTSSENKTGQPEEENERDPPPEWMKKFFKKIAIQTHPDKLANRSDLTPAELKERQNFYKSAVEALDLREEFKLLEIGLELDIIPDIPLEKQIKIISNGINQVKKQTLEKQQLVAWTWGENEGNIVVRTNLLVYIRDYLQMEKVPKEIIEQYLIEYENGDVEMFKKSQIKNKRNIFSRKIGEKPSPSLSSLRKK